MSSHPRTKGAAVSRVSPGVVRPRGDSRVGATIALETVQYDVRRWCE
jgi:hypothetical protein